MHKGFETVCNKISNLNEILMEKMEPGEIQPQVFRLRPRIRKIKISMGKGWWKVGGLRKCLQIVTDPY